MSSRSSRFSLSAVLCLIFIQMLLPEMRVHVAGSYTIQTTTHATPTSSMKSIYNKAVTSNYTYDAVSDNASETDTGPKADDNTANHVTDNGTKPPPVQPEETDNTAVATDPSPADSTETFEAALKLDQENTDTARILRSTDVSPQSEEDSNQGSIDEYHDEENVEPSHPVFNPLLKAILERFGLYVKKMKLYISMTP